ncbi:MAG TPA: nuclease-related domain-containing protein [Archangium sp.]|uniref:nuclease-related domain-containing protein n=1 Tax=Archangium sp. TaxID=1872627 RepID=UPI002E2FA0E1|nr:nuclease-related domain-containing protein [Archangium sp.]HEX5753387.1 nuclease-related domain-containing protein [Archangium sp.]
MFFGRRKEPSASASPRRVGRRPGQSARERQESLRREAPIRTLITRLFNIPTEESAWGKGAEGEEHVAGLLQQLQPHGWAIEHDVKIGARGANIDHLLVGPPGVFVINTKNMGGKVWVAGPHLQVNGQPTHHIEKLEAEAKRVREKLTSATRRQTLWVHGLLVFVKPALTVKKQPQYVSVLADDMLLSFLLQRPAKLGEHEVEELVRAARREETWQ